MKERTPQLQRLSKVRAEFGLLGKDELIRMQSSGVKSDHAKADRELRVRWELDTRRDPEHAQSVDLTSLLEEYTLGEMRQVYSQVSAVQLTSGCNGECPFCLFGIKEGVEKKFTYDSVRTFIQRNWFRQDRKPALFWDSDIGDYKDGTYDISDVFLQTLMHGAGGQFYSTAVPKGSEIALARMTRILANEYKKYIRKTSSPFERYATFPMQLRLSIARHNIQRVESFVECIDTDLSTYPELTGEEKGRFFQDVLIF